MKIHSLLLLTLPLAAGAFSLRGLQRDIIDSPKDLSSVPDDSTPARRVLSEDSPQVRQVGGFGGLDISAFLGGDLSFVPVTEELLESFFGADLDDIQDTIVEHQTEAIRYQLEREGKLTDEISEALGSDRIQRILHELIANAISAYQQLSLQDIIDSLPPNFLLTGSLEDISASANTTFIKELVEPYTIEAIDNVTQELGVENSGPAHSIDELLVLFFDEVDSDEVHENLNEDHSGMNEDHSGMSEDHGSNENMNAGAMTMPNGPDFSSEQLINQVINQVVDGIFSAVEGNTVKDFAITLSGDLSKIPVDQDLLQQIVSADVTDFAIATFPVTAAAAADLTGLPQEEADILAFDSLVAVQSYLQETFNTTSGRIAATFFATDISPLDDEYEQVIQALLDYELDALQSFTVPSVSKAVQSYIQGLNAPTGEMTGTEVSSETLVNNLINQFVDGVFSAVNGTTVKDLFITLSGDLSDIPVNQELLQSVLDVKASEFTEAAAPLTTALVANSTGLSENDAEQLARDALQAVNDIINDTSILDAAVFYAGDISALPDRFKQINEAFLNADLATLPALTIPSVSQAVANYLQELGGSEEIDMPSEVAVNSLINQIVDSIFNASDVSTLKDFFTKVSGDLSDIPIDPELVQTLLDLDSSGFAIARLPFLSTLVANATGLSEDEATELTREALFAVRLAGEQQLNDTSIGSTAKILAGDISVLPDEYQDIYEAILGADLASLPAITVPSLSAAVAEYIQGLGVTEEEEEGEETDLNVPSTDSLTNTLGGDLGINNLQNVFGSEFSDIANAVNSGMMDSLLDLIENELRTSSDLEEDYPFVSVMQNPRVKTLNFSIVDCVTSEQLDNGDMVQRLQVQVTNVNDRCFGNFEVLTSLTPSSDMSDSGAMPNILEFGDRLPCPRPEN